MPAVLRTSLVRQKKKKKKNSNNNQLYYTLLESNSTGIVQLKGENPQIMRLGAVLR